MTDRRVHASDGRVEVVRYEKAGKWYIEIPADDRHPFERVHVGVSRAAQEAIILEDRGGMIHLGIPGGKTFDDLVVRMQS